MKEILLLAKKPQGHNNIYECLDEGVVSLNWLNLFPSSKIQHHNFSSLDHCPISLSINLSQGRKAPPFRFDKLWTTRRDFDCLVKKTWCTQFQGSYMYCFTRKCKLLKSNAKGWA